VAAEGRSGVEVENERGSFVEPRDEGCRQLQSLEARRALLTGDEGRGTNGCRVLRRGEKRAWVLGRGGNERGPSEEVKNERGPSLEGRSGVGRKGRSLRVVLTKAEVEERARVRLAVDRGFEAASYVPYVQRQAYVTRPNPRLPGGRKTVLAHRHYVHAMSLRLPRNLSSSISLFLCLPKPDYPPEQQQVVRQVDAHVGPQAPCGERLAIRPPDVDRLGNELLEFVGGPLPKRVERGTDHVLQGARAKVVRLGTGGVPIRGLRHIQHASLVAVHQGSPSVAGSSSRGTPFET
jgi:hypothetical protein